MIQHDQALKTSFALAAAGPPPAEPGPPPTDAGPVPEVEPPLTPPPASEMPPESAPANFYEPLAPYGTWVNVEGYGLCWQPTVGVVNPGWRPYFDCGHWAYTDCGWYWMSDYSWGWAPFHYGRWFQHNHLGWCWAPDTCWAPSWVCWRTSNEFCGWAPLPPAACYRPGFGFTYYGHSVGFGFEFGLSWNCYGFVGWNHFCDHHLQHWGVPAHQAPQVFHNTVVVNRIVNSHNTVINQGIAPERVAAATHTEVRRVTLRDAGTTPNRAGHIEQLDVRNRTLAVYRPQLPQPTRTASTVIDRSRGEFRNQVNGPASLTKPLQPMQNAKPLARPEPAPLLARTEAPATRTPNLQPFKPATIPQVVNRPALNTSSANPVNRTEGVRSLGNNSQVGTRPPTAPVRQNPPLILSGHSGQNSAHNQSAAATPWLNNAARLPETASTPGFAQGPGQVPGSTGTELPRYSPPQYQQYQYRNFGDVPRYNPQPSFTPARNYSPPETRTAPRSSESYSAPRPSYSEAPRYSPPAPAAPAHSAPAQAPAPSSNSGGDRGGGGRSPR
jgi:hypothetical protein